MLTFSNNSKSTARAKTQSCKIIQKLGSCLLARDAISDASCYKFNFSQSVDGESQMNMVSEALSDEMKHAG